MGAPRGAGVPLGVTLCCCLLLLRLCAASPVVITLFLFADSRTNAKASDDVLEAVSAKLKSYPFHFRGAKILSGQDGGVFGWVTANYLLENFVKYSLFGKWLQTRKGTLGAMDLGGASTQITFETTDKIDTPENEVSLRLYGQSYRVYTHSFLCYGRDQVLKRVLSKVIMSQGYASSIQNPCLPKNYTEQKTFGDVYESACTASERPPNYNPAGELSISGSGDGEQCRRLVDSIFQFSNCPYSSCSFDGIFQPKVNGKFIAFAAFYYTVNFIKSEMKMPADSLEEVRTAADTICNSSFNELSNKVSDSAKKHLTGYCTAANFIYLLLTKGYKFDETTFPNIAIQRKAGDTSIGWALGYMLNLTNMIPAEEASTFKATDFSSWAALVFLFVALILVALVLAFSTFRSSKQQQTI